VHLNYYQLLNCAVDYVECVTILMNTLNWMSISRTRMKFARVENDIMTEEQEEYVTTLQCFGHFERDHVACKGCGVATECYYNTQKGDK